MTTIIEINGDKNYAKFENYESIVEFSKAICDRLNTSLDSTKYSIVKPSSDSLIIRYRGVGIVNIFFHQKMEGYQRKRVTSLIEVEELITNEIFRRLEKI
uniref:hypothetical protein n=1 Tax=Algoriphagus sp. TaxID=1872435 RepID=UPI0040477AD2